jgi:glycolate oxidase subunit GlcD
MIDPELSRQLKRIVGAEHVSTSRVDTEVYAYDASTVVAAPDAVVFPADTEQTAEVVRVATGAGVPCVARGFGTNLSGGSVATRHGLIVGLTRLNRVLEINREGRYAVVEAGLTNLELQNALAPLGFLYAPDPASQKVATMGGNIAENAGGPHCVKYGVTSNHVLGMTVILTGGDVVQVGGPAMDPPGYDLRGVLIGSEGTLGIVTEIVVRIMPSPESVATLLAVYDSLADAARSVSAIIGAGIVPATLEMIDSTVIGAVEDSKPSGYPRDAAAVLIIELDGPGVGLLRQADDIKRLCLEEGCREIHKAKDAAERDRLWAGRRGAFGAIARVSPGFQVADCTVPRTRIPDALAQVDEVAREYGLRHGSAFHAGDGNLHPLLFFDPSDPEQVEKVHRASKLIMQACVDLGGTITGEHGVGVEKKEAMRLIFSEEDLQAQRRLREAFDPTDLINPGKIIPDPLDDQQTASRPAGSASEEHAWGDRITPEDVDQACDVVRQARGNGSALLPVGNATRIDFGNYSERSTTLLGSAGMASVVDYDPANQVITVGAGMSLSALQELLAKNGQWLPLRPPLHQKHTLGGLAALGVCGPERLRYGAPRDLLLGLKFVSGTGDLITAGGRVVKNVAGYDLTRLLVGSAGTLGLITELTFRILSVPECCVALTATGSLEQCAGAGGQVLQSKLEPNLVVAVPNDPSIRASDDTQWRLTVGFEGFREIADVQAKGCGTIFAESGLGNEELSEYRPLDGVCGPAVDVLEGKSFLLRTDVPPDRVLGFATAMWEVLPEAAVLIDFGCGRMLTATAELTDDQWTRVIAGSEKMAGHTILEKSTREFAQRHDVFGSPRADRRLTHQIKAILDPDNVFAPGRLLGRK